MPSLADLEAAERASEERHRKAQQAAAQARQQAEKARAKRLADHDQKLVNGYDNTAEAAAFNRARTALREAIAADPLGKAWVGYKAAELRRTHTASAVNAAADRLGLPHPTVAQPANRAMLEEISRVVDDLAEQANLDFLDELDAARDQAAKD